MAASEPEPEAAPRVAHNAVVAVRDIECRGDICSLWSVITDTERMNRAVGMARVDLTPLSNGSASRYLVSTRLGGFDVQYEERPYEWTYLKAFKVLRKMRTGPVASLEMAYTLDRNKSGGTDVHLQLTMVPRLWLLTPIIKLRAAQSLRQFAREIERVDTAIQAGGEPPAISSVGAVRKEALARAAAKLRTLDPSPSAERLVELVREGSDLDVSRVRPYALADEWKLDRREVLSSCLRAVGAGLLDLRWEIVCPSCRVATDALPSLAALTEHGGCQLCELEFSLDLDDAVEATFAPTAGVRDVDSGPYCIGGPARTPHVVAQAILPAGGQAPLNAPPEPGRFRLFVRGGKAAAVDLVEGGPAERTVDTAELAADQRIELAPGGVLHIRNASPEERHAKLERVLWARQAATARDVTSMPGFRRDFSSDVLRPGTALRVSRVGIFFSDLTASTQLYSNVGDAAAFKLVQEHFDVVIGLVEQHGGTLVKTIGDAVMAVYADEMDGLRASLAILEAFQEFRMRHPTYEQTHIKLGLFAGACYAVTANKVLDYFGQSVNIAARLQGQASSGELVVEAAFADEAIAAGVLPAELVVQRYAPKLKGLDRTIQVARIALAGAPAALASVSGG
jgi:class 3 adenylate cyclase